jgi:hypothetical protein
VRGRFCLVHAGVQDMKALGRRGGRVRPNTKLRKAADDELREKARVVLERALAGDPDVDKDQVAAAKSLFSYRASEAPRQSAHTEQNEGRMQVGLADLFEVAAESHMFSQLGALDVDVEKQMLERLRARQDRQVGAAAAAAEAIVPGEAHVRTPSP